MKIPFRQILLLLLVFFALDAMAQGSNQLTTRNARARRSFERAIEAWRMRDDSRTVAE